MITARNIRYNRVISFSPGWIIFLAWAKEEGFSLEKIRDLIMKDPQYILSIFSQLVADADVEFEEYTMEREDSQEDLSSLLLSLIMQKSN